MNSPQAVFAALEKDSLYTDFKAANKESYLSHFFAQIDSSFNTKSNWDVGIYNKAHDKITIFSKLESDFEIKPEDDVFKKPKESVDELFLDQVTLTFEQAKEKVQDVLKEKFAKEVIGDGFVVLQSFKGKTLWNFSSISRSLKFVNVKIDAASGEVADTQVVELIQK